MSFAFTDSTPSGRLGTAACSTTSWSSSTSVFCTGSVADPLVVTLGGVVGTATLSFTHDGRLQHSQSCCHYISVILPVLVPAPMISFSASENTAASGGGLVTVSGLGFRLTDLTPTAGLASRSCATASWSSRSSVACSAPAGVGAVLEIAMTASGAVGTRSWDFTFDGA